MKNIKEILIVESNTSGNAVHIIKSAQCLGYNCHYLTRDPKLWQYSRSDPVKYANRISIVNTIDIIAILDIIIEDSLAAVFWFDEIRLLPVTLIGVVRGGFTQAQFLSFYAIRYKDKVRSLVNKLSFPIRFKVLDISSRMLESPIGYPCVVKPIDESGSFGVKKCNNNMDFQDACGYIASKDLHVSGYRKKPKILIEEYISGDEYSAEMAWDVEAGWILLGFTKKIKGKEPYFVEIGHIHPYKFGNGLDENIVKTLQNCLFIIGLERSFAHIEFKIINSEVAIIEINPRMPGDLIVELIKMSSDMDIGRIAIFAHANLPWYSSEFKRNHSYAAVSFIYIDRPCLIINVQPHYFSDFIWIKKISSKVTHGLQSSDDRLGCAVAIGNTFQEAWNKALKLSREVHIECADL